ncbi:putative Zn-binding protein involved in type VI secretion [Rahnella sp. BIGb0603]|jgi:uncharacterized Zn-binding protein involved in type VI secretion|uniref:PAAR domain-containing protein n=1 Tax=Rahnella sp. BIGb0603 TaxID=2940612 RepID=UPI0021672A73|nr:PAAR domain-containing protein [Rahnella sp. BIGb0603]MCS3421596.1 putative Zn-binding protein involved in type VI secretion [Rahnella sp. BIGb0603]
MQGVIRLNDPLISGGHVNQASGSEFMGIAVALKGDTVICPEHKGVFPITECHETWTMNGRGVVVNGCKAACGCKIITTLPIAGVA